MESDSDTQSSPPIQTTTGNNDKPYVIFKDKQTRKTVSGEAMASKDRVTFDIPWPHE
jgi:Holliday junction resolvasome RuvABC endonuclease subunit